VVPDRSNISEPKALPLWIALIQKQAGPGEKGVGDTMERIIKNIGLDAFSKLYTYILRKDCGCKNRKDYYNKIYPY
jgi:hypothetical protein